VISCGATHAREGAKRGEVRQKVAARLYRVEEGRDVDRPVHPRLHRLQRDEVACANVLGVTGARPAHANAGVARGGRAGARAVEDDEEHQPRQRHLLRLLARPRDRRNRLRAEAP
jgi:hypothetical protein